MKKNIILSLIALITMGSAFAQVGYVNYDVIYKEYAPAVQLQKQIDKKVQDIRAYNNATSTKVRALKTPEEKAKMITARKEGLQTLEKEYINLRYKQEGLVRLKVKAAADIVIKKKSLDIIIDKSSTVTGGVDCTQDILKAIK